MAVHESLARVVDELDALQAIYGVAECEIDADTLSQLRRRLLDLERAHEEGGNQRTHPVTSLASGVVEMPEVRLLLRTGCYMMAMLPPRYLLDVDAVPLVWFQLSPEIKKQFGAYAGEQLANALQSFVERKTASRDEAVEVLLEIAQEANDLLDNFLGTAVATEVGVGAVANDYDEDAEEISMALELGHFHASSSRPASSKQLGRRLMYSHHIRATSKRAAIFEYGRQLQLSVLSKIGYPGVVLIEGPEPGCEAYVNAISKLRWKHFCVRGEEIVDILNGGELDTVRKLPPMHYKEFGPDEMGEMAAECRKLGVEDLFKTCMKIYR
eukprot:g2631.t1